MKKAVFLCLGFLLYASAVFGQGGAIGLYADTLLYSCDFDDTGPGLVSIYAVHKYSPGASASEWRVVSGGGWNCAWTGDLNHFPTVIGNTQAGITVGYQGCLVSPILLVTINFFCLGTSPPCAFVEVVADTAMTAEGQIQVVDCDYNAHVGVGSKLFVNNDGTCGRPCGIAIRETSWGRVKALYQ